MTVVIYPGTLDRFLLKQLQYRVEIPYKITQKQVALSYNGERYFFFFFCIHLAKETDCIRIRCQQRRQGLATQLVVSYKMISASKAE